MKKYCSNSELSKHKETKKQNNKLSLTKKQIQTFNYKSATYNNNLCQKTKPSVAANLLY